MTASELYVLVSSGGWLLLEADRVGLGIGKSVHHGHVPDGMAIAVPSKGFDIYDTRACRDIEPCNDSPLTLLHTYLPC